MKAKTLMGLGIVFFVFTFVFFSTAEAKTIIDDIFPSTDIEVDVSASIDFYEKYVWRGFLLDKDSVLQPGITISVSGFEGGFWGSWDLESDDALASDEVDGWMGYAFDLSVINEDLEFVGISFGNTWYDFPEGGTYTKELYLGIAFDVFLSPSFTWYHDYGDENNGGADGDYFIFGISYSIELDEEYGITLDLGQELGLNNEAFIMGEGGHSLTTVGVTIPLSEKVTVSPQIGYSMPFGDLEDSNDGAQDDEFFGGVSLAFAF